MPTFTYSPTDSVTFGPTGDVSLTCGGTTTTFSKAGATKTVTQNPPNPTPPAPETPLTQKTRPSGDLIHTYSDITKTPPVTTRITFKATGDVEILVTIGQDRTMTDISGVRGVRRTKIWKDPDPEPEAWTKMEAPKSGHAGGGSSGNGSKGGKKSRKAVRRSRPAKPRVSRRIPKKKAKKKARRR